MNKKRPQSDLEKAKKLSLEEFNNKNGDSKKLPLKESKKLALEQMNESKKSSLEQKNEPNYKYSTATVRGKEARKKLEAFDCEECREFFAGCENPEKFMKNCSKHRAKFAPSTKESPKKIWRMEIDSPDKTQCEPPGKSILNMGRKKK